MWITSDSLGHDSGIISYDPGRCSYPSLLDTSGWIGGTMQIFMSFTSFTATKKQVVGWVCNPPGTFARTPMMSVPSMARWCMSRWILVVLQELWKLIQMGAAAGTTFSRSGQNKREKIHRLRRGGNWPNQLSESMRPKSRLPALDAGLIYVLYETPQQRLAGELALNGAWFEGKKITATGRFAIFALSLSPASDSPLLFLHLFCILNVDWGFDGIFPCVPLCTAWNPSVLNSLQPPL